MDADSDIKTSVNTRTPEVKQNGGVVFETEEDLYRFVFFGDKQPKRAIGYIEFAERVPDGFNYTKSAAVINEVDEAGNDTLDTIEFSQDRTRLEFNLYTKGGADKFLLNRALLFSDTGCNAKFPDEETQQPSSNGGGGGGSLSSSSTNANNANNSNNGSSDDNQGTVLGESTSAAEQAAGEVLGENSCSVPVITEYMNTVNNPSRFEVLKLQLALNIFEGYAIPYTGIYDEATVAAVKRYQLQYQDQILKPWNLLAPTGYVYLTTRKHINERFCEAYDEVIPVLMPDTNMRNKSIN